MRPSSLADQVSAQSLRESFMGTNNRQRRAAKARKRQRRSNTPSGATPSGASGRSSPDPSEASRDDQPACDCFDCHFRDDPQSAIQLMSQLILGRIGLAWQDGWQPAELVRQVRRSLSNRAAGLVRIVILVDDQGRNDQAKHPRWQAQIDHLARGVRNDDIADDWLTPWIDVDSSGSIGTAIDELIVELDSLRSLHRLIPPPGSSEADCVAGDDNNENDDPLLARVRALLAQAESTSFPAEAEAFTAKAQALMSRHSIDEALIRDRDGRDGRPVAVRLPIDDPYVSEKADLLHVVANASRCRSIHMTGYAMSMVIGAASDVRRVDLLFTSLLVQAQAALNHEATASGAGSHNRSRGFRAAFLAGYASRIGVRLTAENDRAVDETTADVLPVLARQSKSVDDEIERLFGSRLTRVQGKRRNLAGWTAGTDAADQAHLTNSGLTKNRSGPSSSLGTG